MGDVDVPHSIHYPLREGRVYIFQPPLFGACQDGSKGSITPSRRGAIHLHPAGNPKLPHFVYVLLAPTYSAQMAPTITLNTGIVIGIAVGGAVALFVVSSVLTLVLLKLRQRRFTARNGGSRLSRFAFNISNPELNGIPRVRSVLRRPSRNPYGSGWVGISSLDSLAQNSVLYNQSQGDQPQGNANEHTRYQPRRLIKPYPKSLGPTGALPLCSVSEPSTSLDDRLPHGFGPNRSLLVRGVINQPSPLSTVISAEPERAKPRPHFWGQQRSLSSNAAFQSSPSKQAAALPKSDSRPTVRRSVSLHSQLAGPAPMEPLPSPPLPCLPRLSRIEMLKDNQGRKSWTSMRSSTSLNSTISNDYRPFSCTETDYTSNSFQPSQSNRDSKRSAQPFDGGDIGDWSRTKMFTTGSSQSTAANTKPPLNSQKSFSIEQYQIPRDKSSSLSLSLVDDKMLQTPTRSDSTASKLERTSREVFKLCNMSPNYIESFDKITDVDSPNDVGSKDIPESSNSDMDPSRKYKRASTSILKEVSGNEGMLYCNEFQKRPTSLPLSQPVRWNQPEPVRLPMTRNRSRGHRRQNCVRISYTSPRNSVLIPPVEEVVDLEEAASKPLHFETEAGGRYQFRPPSRPSFSPQLTWAPIQTIDKPPTDEYDSQTMRICNFYQAGLNKEPDPTPTRKPSRRIKPVSSRRDTFKTPDDPDWPFTASKSIGDFRSSVLLNQPPSPTILISKAESRPSSFLFQKFPNPHYIDGSRQIQGPRAPPARYEYPRRGRSPTKRSSPVRDVPRFKLASSSVSPLKESVRELRRMKSDLSILSNLEKSFYLNIGRESADLKTCVEEGGKTGADSAATKLKAKGDLSKMEAQLGHRNPVMTVETSESSSHRAPTMPDDDDVFYNTSRSTSLQPSPSGSLTPKAKAPVPVVASKPSINIIKPHTYIEDIFEPTKKPCFHTENIFNRALGPPPVSIPGLLTSVPTISSSTSSPTSSSRFVTTHYIPAPPPPGASTVVTQAPLYPTLRTDLQNKKAPTTTTSSSSPTTPSPPKVEVRTPTRGSKDWKARQEALGAQKSQGQQTASSLATGSGGRAAGGGGWKWPADANRVAVELNRRGNGSPQGKSVIGARSTDMTTSTRKVAGSEQSETSETFERIVQSAGSGSPLAVTLTASTQFTPDRAGWGVSRDVTWNNEEVEHGFWEGHAEGPGQAEKRESLYDGDGFLKGRCSADEGNMIGDR